MTTVIGLIKPYYDSNKDEVIDNIWGLNPTIGQDFTDEYFDLVFHGEEEKVDLIQKKNSFVYSKGKAVFDYNRLSLPRLLKGVCLDEPIKASDIDEDDLPCTPFTFIDEDVTSIDDIITRLIKIIRLHASIDDFDLSRYDDASRQLKDSDGNDFYGYFTLGLFPVNDSTVIKDPVYILVNRKSLKQDIGTFDWLLNKDALLEYTWGRGPGFEKRAINVIKKAIDEGDIEGDYFPEVNNGFDFVAGELVPTFVDHQKGKGLSDLIDDPTDPEKVKAWLSSIVDQPDKVVSYEDEEAAYTSRATSLTVPPTTSNIHQLEKAFHDATGDLSGIDTLWALSDDAGDDSQVDDTDDGKILKIVYWGDSKDAPAPTRDGYMVIVFGVSLATNSLAYGNFYVYYKDEEA